MFSCQLYSYSDMFNFNKKKSVLSYVARQNWITFSTSFKQLYLGSCNSPKHRTEELTKFFAADLTTDVNMNETLYNLDT
jgi:hypothetical protein